MATQGSKKQLSEEHENRIATFYGGKRSASSGAAVTDQGDVRTPSLLIECKGQFGERTGQKPVRSTLLTQMEKITDEAYAEGKTPAIALRYYVPDSPLADNYGYVDLMVKFLEDSLGD